MVMINYLTKVHYPWSLITGAGLLYIYLFLLYWIRHDSGFAAKVGLQLFATAVFLFVIDYVNGFYGWSLQWAIPGIILLGDGIVTILMILNRSRWQSYLLLLLFMGICSLAIIILYFTNVIGSLLMPALCAGVTLFYFLGAILLGGSAAGRELSRRFHIWSFQRYRCNLIWMFTGLWLIFADLRKLCCIGWIIVFGSNSFGICCRVFINCQTLSARFRTKKHTGRSETVTKVILKFWGKKCVKILWNHIK